MSFLPSEDRTPSLKDTVLPSPRAPARFPLCSDTCTGSPSSYNVCRTSDTHPLPPRLTRPSRVTSVCFPSPTRLIHSSNVWGALSVQDRDGLWAAKMKGSQLSTDHAVPHTVPCRAQGASRRPGTREGAKGQGRGGEGRGVHCSGQPCQDAIPASPTALFCPWSDSMSCRAWLRFHHLLPVFVLWLQLLQPPQRVGSVRRTPASTVPSHREGFYSRLSCCVAAWPRRVE